MLTLTSLTLCVLLIGLLMIRSRIVPWDTCMFHASPLRVKVKRPLPPYTSDDSENQPEW
ncbi:MAG: hypothetical protein ACRC10_04580 [Thermoguttaceae bacterium]